jgi:hypothetical protein
VYFTNGMKSPQLLAESAPIEFSNYHLPMQIHLALTNIPTQMRVDWTSVSRIVLACLQFFFLRALAC